jgi:hypothetical protein
LFCENIGEVCFGVEINVSIFELMNSSPIRGEELFDHHGGFNCGNEMRIPLNAMDASA